MIAALIVSCYRCKEAVGRSIDTVMKLYTVRTIHSWHICKGRLCSRTRKRSYLLRYLMGIGSLKVQPLYRLCINLQTCRPCIATASVLKNECLGSCTEVGWEYRAVVGTIPTCKSFYVAHAPV